MNMQDSHAVATIPTLKVLTGAEMTLPFTHCRYKTGRCPKPRAVKANGTLLLLCEYHRNQQNRTKKRSDVKCRHNRAKKRQAQRENLQKKQLSVVPVDEKRSTLRWTPSTLPLASIIAPHIDEYAASSPLTVTDPEKVFESTSPTVVDFNVSLVNWIPRCVSPNVTPTMCLQDNSFALEDIWLLEYFIL
ncbi:unnamed protein product [Peronospora destructor]|uniref:Uncharacterized protein n=1 Tax=Peronospora destructor TaxID=86335 RepID=A0AAV0UNL7_9STRA|nr:unnamed protein product [Peronospora destructor]